MLCTKFDKKGAKIPSKTTVKSTSQLGSILDPTWLHFGRVLEAKLEPRSHQIVPKVDPKNDQKKDHLLDGSCNRFGSILAPAWGGPSGYFLATFWLLGPLGLLTPLRTLPRPILAPILKDSGWISEFYLVDFGIR